MEKTDNPYTILGLSINADESAIKKAYFQLAKKWHPDKQKTDADREAATQLFAKIADAYALLQDPVRRYDWRQANESGSSSTTTTRSSPPPSSRTSSERSCPMRSSSPKRTSSNKNTSSSAPKRTNSNPSFSTMPKSKKLNIIRMSPEQDRKSSVRPSVRGPAATRQSVPRRRAGRSSARTSGGTRSPVRNSVRSPVPNSPRSPIRKCERATARTSGGQSPVCYSGGKLPTRASTAFKTVRRSQHTPPMASPPGRRKQTPTSSVGRKPRKNGLDSHSAHIPRSKVTR